MTIIRFTNCKLCDEGRVYKSDLLICTKSGKIVSPRHAVDKTIDLDGLIITPGYIDPQINGCFGFNFSHFTNKEEYLEGYDKCMKRLVKTGTTSICPTLVTCTPENYVKILPLVGADHGHNRTESLGAHCEGPVISLEKRGCHDPRNLRRPKTEQELFDVYGGEQNFKYMKILTAAPELEGFLDLIPAITSRDIIYSIGHTTATFEQSLAAVKKGATMITHLFNAMPQPHHRSPGPIGLEGLAEEEQCPYFGIIADGIHIHHSYINIMYNSNKDRCCLVTDAVNLMGLPDGVYPWEDRFVEKKGRLLTLQGTNTIIGSATDQAQCMRNLVAWCEDVQFAQAIKCVTNHPAQCLHVDDHKGFLRVGYDADLCVVDNSGHVRQVYKFADKVFDIKADKVSRL